MVVLRFLLRSSKKLLLVALVASTLSGFGSAALVALINRALQTPPEQLAPVGFRFGALCVAVLGLRWLSQSVFVQLSQRTLANLRLYLSRELAKAPYRHIEAQGSARLFALLTEDVHTVADLFMTLPNFSMHGAVVLGCLGYLALLSWKVFAFALLVTLLGAAVYHRGQARALNDLRDARLEQDQLFQHFRALHDGAKELKLHRRRREAFFDELLGASVERVRRKHTRGMLTYVAAESVGTTLFFGFIGLVLFGFSRWLAVDAAVMSGYALVFLHMVLPMEALLLAIPNINRARVALERVQSGTLCAERQEVLPSADVPLEPLHFVSLRLRGVAHRYHREGEEGHFEVGPIDLEITAGEVVFLTGGNGSGKTTLAKLLTGLYAPERGVLYLNGKAVSDAGRDRYRQHFSAIFADFFVFERLLGIDVDTPPAPSVDSAVRPLPALDRSAEYWLAEFGLSHKVKVTGGVFSTTRLSQGQRKRLALVVAYLEDRPLYLFDEWAADQDPEYKEVFYKRLLPELKRRGKTVIAITHDDRYFHLADRCIKLEYGKIVADEARAPSVVHGGSVEMTTA
ncbi:MAG: cyclic peptide export ABC transporter [Myxococcota bacterium]